MQRHCIFRNLATSLCRGAVWLALGGLTGLAGGCISRSGNNTVPPPPRTRNAARPPAHRQQARRAPRRRKMARLARRLRRVPGVRREATTLPKEHCHFIIVVEGMT